MSRVPFVLFPVLLLATAPSVATEQSPTPGRRAVPATPAQPVQPARVGRLGPNRTAIDPQP